MTEKPLSEKIEVVGFYTEIEFKDKEGNVKMIPATRGEEGLKVKDVSKAVEELKRKRFTSKCGWDVVQWEDVKEIFGSFSNHTPEGKGENREIGDNCENRCITPETSLAINGSVTSGTQSPQEDSELKDSGLTKVPAESPSGEVCENYVKNLNQKKEKVQNESRK